MTLDLAGFREALDHYIEELSLTQEQIKQLPKNTAYSSLLK